MITEGLVRHLRLHIPWTSLMSAPIEIHLDAMEIDAVYDPEAAMAAAAAAQGKRKQGLAEAAVEEPILKEGAEVEGGWGAWVITKLRNNVSVTVQKLLVRLRFEGHIITLRMEALSCHSVNYLWERAVVV